MNIRMVPGQGKPVALASDLHGEVAAAMAMALGYSAGAQVGKLHMATWWGHRWVAIATGSVIISIGLYMFISSFC